MDAASFQFVLFGLMVAVVSNFRRSSTWRLTILLLSSFLFLGLLAQRWTVLLPLAGFLLLGYAGLVMLAQGWPRAMVASIVAVIFSFLWLKKYTVLPEAIFLTVPYFTLGLSYIFFRVLHLLIESGQQQERRLIGFGAYLAYTLNFTTLVSGPIQRYDEFAADQFAEQPIPLGASVVGLQLARIIVGFFKVNVVALLFNLVREDALSQLSQPGTFTVKFSAAVLVAVAYPFFLYANFSGYIDIVIALARLLRLRLPENFDRPFSASSFLDFWNRWHITLSTWLKTYIYNPLLLTLMRRFPSPELSPFLGVFSLFVTFFLVGIWHGRTSEFLLFGVLQGAGVSLNQLWRVWLTRAIGRKKYKLLGDNGPYIAFSRGLTFTWFAFTLFWFWANWGQIHVMFAVLGLARWILVWSAVWLCATAVLSCWEWLRGRLLSIQMADAPVLTSRYATVVYSTALLLVILIMTAVLDQPAPDIVYKAF